ncbi:hypothetical protein Nepgr_016873 [Nepenthes gracilis]|uniref:Uncharacterized protein n=1 Tax=Nepenthes gracilis TaxID=150966 RepID=A0AAD3SRC2_NEPGR|nr:hypothetical protein Nepgr_016873 [Nepenthes gracilis]
MGCQTSKQAYSSSGQRGLGSVSNEGSEEDEERGEWDVIRLQVGALRDYDSTGHGCHRLNVTNSSVYYWKLTH